MRGHREEKQKRHLVSGERGNETSLSSCRPLSVISVTGKITAQILKRKISANSRSNRSGSNRRFRATGIRLARKPKYFSETALGNLRVRKRRQKWEFRSEKSIWCFRYRTLNGENNSGGNHLESKLDGGW